VFKVMEDEKNKTRKSCVSTKKKKKKKKKMGKKGGKKEVIPWGKCREKENERQSREERPPDLGGGGKG